MVGRLRRLDHDNVLALAPRHALDLLRKELLAHLG